MWIINWEVSFLLQIFSQMYLIHKIKRWKWILCTLLKLESTVKEWNYPEFWQYHEFNNMLFVKHSYSTLFIFNDSSWEISVLNVYCFSWFMSKCETTTWCFGPEKFCREDMLKVPLCAHVVEKYWQIGQGGFCKAQFVWTAVMVNEQTSTGHKVHWERQWMVFWVGAFF